MLEVFLQQNLINLILILGFFVVLFITKSIKLEKTKVIVVLLISSLFTIFSEFFQYYLTGYEYNELRKFLSIFNHIIIPIEICLILLYYSSVNSKKKLLLFIPAVINMIIYLLSINSKFVFYYDDLGVFRRGPLGIAIYITYGVYLLISIIQLVIYIKQKDKTNFLCLMFSSILCLLCFIFELVFNLRSLKIFALLISVLILFVKNYIFYSSEISKNQEKLLQEQRTSLTISQIQPHFLYNTLGTIGYLCKKDPMIASKAIDEFSDYLRANLNSIAQKNNVPFPIELKHVKTYLWLEQLRFEERLHVEYDIEVSDFLVPSLSIQPIVENAVKHGICEKENGGTIIIRTIGYNNCIKIIIEDDGVGFDSTQINDGKTHIGIENVKSRLLSMCNGKLEIQSSIGKGTKVTITLPRS